VSEVLRDSVGEQLVADDSRQPVDVPQLALDAGLGLHLGGADRPDPLALLEGDRPVERSLASDVVELSCEECCVFESLAGALGEVLQLGWAASPVTASRPSTHLSIGSRSYIGHWRVRHNDVIPRRTSGVPAAKTSHYAGRVVTGRTLYDHAVDVLLDARDRAVRDELHA